MPLSRRPSSAPMAPHVPFQSARHFGYLHQLNPKQHLKILSHRLSFSPISPTEIRETYKTKSGSGQKSKKKKKTKGFSIKPRKESRDFEGSRGERGTDYGSFIRNRLRHPHLQRWLLLRRSAVGCDDFAYGEEDVGSAEYVFFPSILR